MFAITDWLTITQLLVQIVYRPPLAEVAAPAPRLARACAHRTSAARTVKHVLVCCHTVMVLRLVAGCPEMQLDSSTSRPASRRRSTGNSTLAAALRRCALFTVLVMLSHVFAALARIARGVSSHPLPRSLRASSTAWWLTATRICTCSLASASRLQQARAALRCCQCKLIAAQTRSTICSRTIQPCSEQRLLQNTLLNLLSQTIRVADWHQHSEQQWQLCALSTFLQLLPTVFGSHRLALAAGVCLRFTAVARRVRHGD